MQTDFDATLKLQIYEITVRDSKIPTSHEIALAMGAGVREVEAGLARLHAKRLIVPEPGESSRIRMAPPFSGVKTPFMVRVGKKSYYANCVWDALGVSAALHCDAIVDASDAHTGEQITLEVKEQKPLPHSAVSHFAVPAALWWQDIIYT